MGKDREEGVEREDIKGGRIEKEEGGKEREGEEARVACGLLCHEWHRKIRQEGLSEEDRRRIFQRAGHWQMGEGRSG